MLWEPAATTDARRTVHFRRPELHHHVLASTGRQSGTRPSDAGLPSPGSVLDTGTGPLHSPGLKLPFLRTVAALGASTLLQITGFAAGLADQVAIQTWTLRNLTFEQVVEFAQRHGIKDLQMIDKHMNPKAPLEETKKKKAILDAAGLHVYTFGVAATSLDREDNRKLFEFAKFMGIQVIVVEPGDFRIWDNLEALVKEYDIKLAIHNHGIKSLYGNPAIVKQIIQDRDQRIGV